MNELTLLNYVVGSASFEILTTAVVIMSRSSGSGVRFPVETPVIRGKICGLDLIRAPDFSETLSRRARTSGGTAYPAVPRYQPRDIAKFRSCATTLR